MISGQQLVQSRQQKGLEQQEAAERLEVSQPYLSLLESGKRRITRKLAERAVKVFALPPEKLPLPPGWETSAEISSEELAGMLAALGYPKFSHLKKGKLENPGWVLFSALKDENLDSRIAESLPWIVFTFPELDWENLIKFAKQFDLQNRLGFVVNLARQLAMKAKDTGKNLLLSEVEKQLEESRLLREDALGNLTRAEIKYLKANRPKEAKYWRVLSDLSVEHLNYI